MEWQALEDGTAASNAISYSNGEHISLLSKGLNGLREEAVFCDVILRAGGKTFPAHRCVLATCSPYFKAMFASDMKESHEREVTLKDIEPAILESLLEFLYTGTIVITHTNVQSLVAASNVFQVLGVRDACSLFMTKRMDASNCLGIQIFAETMNCERLHETAKEFALSNLPDLAEHEEFLNLPLAKVVELVSSDALDVPREEDVFTAVLKWFHHQPEARKDCFHKVLECVRLPLMSPHFLHDYVSNQQIVRTSLECHILLEEALMYHLMPDRRSDMQSARTRPRRSNELVDVIVCVGGAAGRLTGRSLEAFDAVSNQWVSLCDLPYPVRSHGVVVTEENILYVAGGSSWDGTRSNRLLKFDPQVNEWQEMASMSFARSGLGVAVLNRFLYAVGGWDGVESFDSFERYNLDTNQWEQLPALQTTISHATVISHEGYLYVAGGMNNVRQSTRLQRFDPRTRAWTDMAPMRVPRRGATGCILDGKLYIIGGITNIAISEVECYDFHNDQWNFCSTTRVRRDCPGAAAIGGHIYVLGGKDTEEYTRLNSVERYTPATDRWEDVHEMTMPLPRSLLGCAALKVRKLLLPSGEQ